MARLKLLLIFPACLLAAIYSLINYIYCVYCSPDKAFRLAVAFDRLGNAATNGLDTETISSRANRARKEGRIWGCVLCSFLDIFDYNHCEKQ